MRRRGLQVFVLVSVVVILSVVALVLEDLPFTDAAGGGPLGLTLGLDLQGGSLLIYEAELPDQASVTFSSPVEQNALLDHLSTPEVGQDRATTSQREYTITEVSLADVSERELGRSIEVLGTLDHLQLSGDSVEFAFAAENDETSTGDDPAPSIDEALRQVLNNLGYVDAVLESTGENSYRASGLRVESRAELQIEEALSQLSPLALFELDEGSIEVVFEEALVRFEVETAFNDIAPTAEVEVADQTSYELQDLSIAPEDQVEFETALATLAPLENIIVEVVEPTLRPDARRQGHHRRPHQCLGHH